MKAFLLSFGVALLFYISCVQAVTAPSPEDQVLRELNKRNYFRAAVMSREFLKADPENDRLRIYEASANAGLAGIDSVSLFGLIRSLGEGQQSSSPASFFGDTQPVEGEATEEGDEEGNDSPEPENGSNPEEEEDGEESTVEVSVIPESDLKALPESVVELQNSLSEVSSHFKTIQSILNLIPHVSEDNRGFLNSAFRTLERVKGPTLNDQAQTYASILHLVQAISHFRDSLGGLNLNSPIDYLKGLTCELELSTALFHLRQASEHARRSAELLKESYIDEDKKIHNNERVEQLQKIEVRISKMTSALDQMGLDEIRILHRYFASFGILCDKPSGPG